jgi:dTDP-4-amino-4,6-dideoxygalactose transaminase
MSKVETVTGTSVKPIRSEPLPLEFPGVHHMDEAEVNAAVRVLRARSPFRYYGVDLLGEVDAFETEFARFLGSSYALAVSSGAGALAAALSALRVGPGQEIIIPAYLWVSVASAVVNQGAIPVLADIDETFCLNPAALEPRIGPKTTGIIMVHMSGAPGDAPAVRELSRRHGLWLLEDCAQCIGGSIHGRRVGTFGDMAIFSFQMNKNMTAGEGGCLVTDNQELYRRAFACHDMGFPRAAGRLKLDDPSLCLWGKGVRLDEIRAAVLRVQLAKLPRILEAMRSSKYRIREALSRFPEVELRKIQDPQGDTGCFLIVTLPDRNRAEAVNRRTLADGINTLPQGISNILMTDWGLHVYFNIPSLVHRTSVDGRGFPWGLEENRGLGHNYAKGACPVADNLFERSILLPIPSCLTRRDEDDIIGAFERALGPAY